MMRTAREPSEQVGGLLAIARTRAGRIGAAIAAIALVGMLAGVIVEFWIFGGLVGDLGTEAAAS